MRPRTIGLLCAIAALVLYGCLEGYLYVDGGFREAFKGVLAIPLLGATAVGVAMAVVRHIASIEASHPHGLVGRLVHPAQHYPPPVTRAYDGTFEDPHASDEKGL